MNIAGQSHARQTRTRLAFQVEYQSVHPVTKIPVSSESTCKNWNDENNKYNENKGTGYPQLYYFLIMN